LTATNATPVTIRVMRIIVSMRPQFEASGGSCHGPTAVIPTPIATISRMAAESARACIGPAF